MTTQNGFYEAFCKFRGAVYDRSAIELAKSYAERDLELAVTRYTMALDELPDLVIPGESLHQRVRRINSELRERRGEINSLKQMTPEKKDAILDSIDENQIRLYAEMQFPSHWLPEIEQASQDLNYNRSRRSDILAIRKKHPKLKDNYLFEVFVEMTRKLSKA